MEAKSVDSQIMIFLGPPGAGKGTQAERVALEKNLVKISTGDMMRAEAARGTELGQLVAPLLSEGKLVPDHILLPIVMGSLSSMSPVRVVLDGFPRNPNQAKVLDETLESLNTVVSQVILLEVPEQVVLERIVARGVSSGRSDDTIETARARQQVYQSETQPLVDFYESQGKLARVDGMGSMDEVYGRILTVVSQLELVHRSG
jgi:adenylate kinase